MRSRAAPADKAATEPQLAPDVQDAHKNSILPPRIVVELPDGGVQIGEDSQRLQHEQTYPASSTARTPDASTHRAGAQPGTEQWLELRRLLYATALEAVSLKRKRISSFLLAIDFLYTLMALADAIIHSDENRYRWLPSHSVKTRLPVAVMGSMLDFITIVVVLRERWKAIRVATALHLILLVPEMIQLDVPLAIIRILAASCLGRLIASLVELDWVVRGQPLIAKPTPAWLQAGLLGVQLCGLRDDYMYALEQMERLRASNEDSSSSESDFNTSTVILLRSSTLHANDVTENAAGADVPRVEIAAGDTQQQSQHPPNEGSLQWDAPREASDRAAGGGNGEPVQEAPLTAAQVDDSSGCSQIPEQQAHGAVNLLSASGPLSIAAPSSTAAVDGA